MGRDEQTNKHKQTNKKQNKKTHKKNLQVQEQ
jgi:hypothetical protein